MYLQGWAGGSGGCKRQRKSKLKLIKGMLPVLFLLLLAACGPSRRGEPFSSLQLTSAESKGQEHFMRHCHECHPGGAAGLGPALNNKPLPRWLMRQQVRHGLGAMPGFSAQEISDENLDLILDYLKALRATGRA
jgi:mono/diheme cytochrome c family protein